MNTMIIITDPIIDEMSQSTIIASSTSTCIILTQSILMKYFVYRKKKNEKLPTSQEELMTMQESDPRIRIISAKM